MHILIKRREVADPHDLSTLHPILRRIYGARGVTTSSELEKELDHLLPFHTLKNIDAAGYFLANAVIAQKRLVIIGDYDTDGATSTAVAMRALRLFGALQVDFLVPNRFEYGYGLTPEIVQLSLEKKPDVLITVDNGISSVAGVAFAKAKGLSVVITDHHLAGSVLPDADVIVNPNQPDDSFPSKYLAGVGTIFYVMLAVRQQLSQQGWFTSAVPSMASLLDLVALGTVADVVPLDKNNRILVHQGLKRIRAKRCAPGIIALLDIGKRDVTQIVASDLGFTVAPRLNAAGRLEDMSLGIRCLISDEVAEVKMIAARLDQLNEERKQLEKTMQQEAHTLLSQLPIATEQRPLGFCLYRPQWHQGIIGILAGRIKEKWHRPTVVFAKGSETELKGSARSIPGLHIRDVFDVIAAQHPDVILKFGGHAMAAGLTIPIDCFSTFKLLFEEQVAKQLTEAQLQNILLSDGELTEKELTLTLAELLKTEGPWGATFPEPLFDGQFRIVDQRLVSGKHLKLTLAFPDSMRAVDAIAFNVDTAEWPKHRCESVHIVYRLDVNAFSGYRKVQLVIEHLQAIRN